MHLTFEIHTSRQAYLLEQVTAWGFDSTCKFNGLGQSVVVLVWSVFCSWLLIILFADKLLSSLHVCSFWELIIFNRSYFYLMFVCQLFNKLLIDFNNFKWINWMITVILLWTIFSFLLTYNLKLDPSSPTPFTILTKSELAIGFNIFCFNLFLLCPLLICSLSPFATGSKTCCDVVFFFPTCSVFARGLFVFFMFGFFFLLIWPSFLSV